MEGVFPKLLSRIDGGTLEIRLKRFDKVRLAMRSGFAAEPGEMCRLIASQNDRLASEFGQVLVLPTGMLPVPLGFVRSDQHSAAGYSATILSGCRSCCGVIVSTASSTRERFTPKILRRGGYLLMSPRSFSNKCATSSRSKRLVVFLITSRVYTVHYHNRRF
jgi:hypothetical protein